MRPRWILAALALMLFCAGPARAVDVSNLSAVENTPCFRALSDRNAAEKADAPDSALVDACDAVGGEAEAAWRKLTVLWQPRQPGASATSAAGQGGGGTLLSILGLLLAYAVLGAPLRSLAALMGAAAPHRAAAPVAVLALALRIALGLLLFGLLLLPGAGAIGALSVLALAVLASSGGWHGGVTPVELSEPPSRAAVILAGAIDDAAAGAAGLVTLALLARHDPRLLAVALVLAVPASMPAMLKLRRRLRRSPEALAGAAAALAAVAGAVAVADGGGASAAGWPAILVPLLLAAAVIGAALLARRTRARSGSA